MGRGATKTWDVNSLCNLANISLSGCLLQFQERHTRFHDDRCCAHLKWPEFIKRAAKSMFPRIVTFPTAPFLFLGGPQSLDTPIGTASGFAEATTFFGILRSQPVGRSRRCPPRNPGNSLGHFLGVLRSAPHVLVKGHLHGALFSG